MTFMKAMTAMKRWSSAFIIILRAFITWRTVRRLGSRLSSRSLYIVLCDIPEMLQNSFRDMFSSSSRMLRRAFWKPPSSLSIPAIRSGTVIPGASRNPPRTSPRRSPGLPPWRPATAFR